MPALMLESLKANRVQACDGERIVLHCPRNTQILIESAFYGRVVPSSQLCPASQNPRVALLPDLFDHEDTTCDVLQAFTRLREMCEKKRKCGIHVDPSTFDGDPCPRTSKYLQVSYKCKPISFDDASFCADSEMQLTCREGKRLAIYSAKYGRTVNGQAMHCDPVTPITSDCEADVLPRVLARCHAQTECNLSVGDRLFGSPCPPHVTKYLNIIFMCVNEEVFSEAAITGSMESLKELIKEGSGLDEEWTDEEHGQTGVPLVGHLAATTSPFTTTPMPFSNDAEYISEDRVVMRRGYEDYKEKKREQEEEELLMRDVEAATSPNAVGIVHDLVVIASFITENKEKAFLCVVLSGSLALILLLIACILGQTLCRRTEKEKRPRKVEYSIERNNLLAKQAALIDGGSGLFEMGDLADDDTYLRFSIATPPRSADQYTF